MENFYPDKNQDGPFDSFKALFVSLFAVYVFTYPRNGRLLSLFVIQPQRNGHPGCWWHIIAYAVCDHVIAEFVKCFSQLFVNLCAPNFPPPPH